MANRKGFAPLDNAPRSAWTRVAGTLDLFLSDSKRAFARSKNLR